MYFKFLQYVQRNVINCCKTMNPLNSIELSKQLHIKVLNYDQCRIDR